MPNPENNHPQYTREQVIAHCRKWLDAYSYSGGSVNQTLLNNYLEATIETDVLTYPLETQEWIDKDSEPELWAIIIAADEVDRNHSDPEAWRKLVEKVEAVV